VAQRSKLIVLSPFPKLPPSGSSPLLTQLDGLWWLLLMLGPLIFLQRRLHFEMQSVLLLVFRRIDIALAIFSLFFFPGVLLHELSHWLMAKILRVPTGGISLIPKSTGDGRLQMGYVMTAQTDVVRDALIGLAPLISGGILVGWLGNAKLNFLALGDALLTTDFAVVLGVINQMLMQPDFAMWFYFAFAVSSMMMPSPADRRSWLPVGIAIVILVSIGLLLDFGPWLMTNFGTLTNNAFRTVAIVFAISAGLHLIVLIPMMGFRMLLNKLTGLEVN
jgi:hypothetical protein